MKKTLVLTALLIGIFSFNIANAHPEQAPGPKSQTFHEQMLFMPDFTDMLLGNKELNLTDKQKTALKKASKSTTKKVRKLDKKIRDTKDERIYLVGEHFKTIQNILTDEQKETLYQQHQKQIEEKMAKFQERQQKQCKCGEKCNCSPKCTCTDKIKCNCSPKYTCADKIKCNCSPKCTCADKTKCNCAPKCTCAEKKPCPVDKKCTQVQKKPAQAQKPTVQPKPQPVKK